MTDADRVDVGERTEELVHVELDVMHWHRLLELGVVTGGAVDSLGHELEHKVEVNLILLGLIIVNTNEDEGDDE